MNDLTVLSLKLDVSEVNPTLGELRAFIERAENHGFPIDTYVKVSSEDLTITEGDV